MSELDSAFVGSFLKSNLQVLVEMSRVQDSEVGDGTTSVTVLASELIREAEKLVDMRIHPQVTPNKIQNIWPCFM